MTNEETIRALAEQSYLYHLLLKILREQDILQPGQPAAGWNQVEFEEFLKDFRAHYFSEER